MPKFVDVAVSLPIDRLFQYAVPEGLSAEIAVGKRLLVPFQNRTVVGYVVAVSDQAETEKIKEIGGVIDAEPILKDEMLILTKWIGDNYFCSWGEAIGAAIPSGIKKGAREIGLLLKASGGK